MTLARKNQVCLDATEFYHIITSVAARQAWSFPRQRTGYSLRLWH